jgi:hypothetical protein
VVSKIEMEDRWLVKIHGLPDEMKTKYPDIKLFRPLGIGGDRSYMMNATDCGQGRPPLRRQRFQNFPQD